MFGGWKFKAQKLKTTVLVGGWQSATELVPRFAKMLELFGVAARTGDASALDHHLKTMEPLTAAERPLHEPASINGWDIQAMFYKKDGELWWLVHATRKNEVLREKDAKLMYHVLELLGGRPEDAIIDWRTTGTADREATPFGWWTWRNVSPLMEMQLNPNKKPKDMMRIVRKDAPATDGYQPVPGAFEKSE